LFLTFCDSTKGFNQKSFQKSKCLVSALIQKGGVKAILMQGDQMGLRKNVQK
jgi:hypothetical protein